MQVLMECHGCDQAILDDLDRVGDALRQAAQAGGATIVNEAFHKFAPQGVSGVLVIAESHLSVHTWPEHGYAAIDLFTCGDRCDVWAMKSHLETALKTSHVSVTELRRGLINPSNSPQGPPAPEI